MTRRILFDRSSECLQPLLSLIEQQKHRTLVLWALEYADALAGQFDKKYPDDPRPRQAVEAGTLWAQGFIKMPVAKPAILAAHRAAADIAEDRVYSAVAHAIGQAVATIHTEAHAIGAPIYALTALFYASAPENAQKAVASECNRLCERLLYWQENVDAIQRPWAAFLLREDVPNKEKLRREKRIH